jgi:hypothetical protein
MLFGILIPRLKGDDCKFPAYPKEQGFHTRCISVNILRRRLVLLRCNIGKSICKPEREIKLRKMSIP